VIRSPRRQHVLFIPGGEVRYCVLLFLDEEGDGAGGLKEVIRIQPEYVGIVVVAVAAFEMLRQVS
jgi:hypothetical protein